MEKCNLLTDCENRLQTRIVTTKQGITPHVALSYLNGLRVSAVDLMDDPEYCRAFEALENCVLDMLETPYDGNITAEYVVVEQEEITQTANAETVGTDEKVA